MVYGGRITMTNSADDMAGRDFATILRRARAHYPISDAYESEHLPGNHWWSNQQEHVTTWLGQLDGPGEYGRITRGLGARHAYNHFQCAPGLLLDRRSSR